MWSESHDLKLIFSRKWQCALFNDDPTVPELKNIHKVFQMSQQLDSQRV